MTRHHFMSVPLWGFCSSLLLIFLTACSGNNASHLPSIFQLPGAVFGSVLENTTYNARRRKVESYVAKHYLGIREDVDKGGGSILEGALDITDLKGVNRNKARDNFLNDRDHYFHHLDLVADNLMHDFSSLYGIKQVDKKVNGFTYTEARNIIREYADTNFDVLRLAIQKGEGDALDQLGLRLQIDDTDKLVRFRQKAKALYKTIYLELVTVGLMVHR